MGDIEYFLKEFHDASLALALLRRRAKKSTKPFIGRQSAACNGFTGRLIELIVAGQLQEAVEWIQKFESIALLCSRDDFIEGVRRTLTSQRVTLEMLLQEQKLLDPARSRVEQAILRALLGQETYLTARQIHKLLPPRTVGLKKLAISLEMILQQGLLSRIQRSRGLLYALCERGRELAQKLPPSPS